LTEERKNEDFLFVCGTKKDGRRKKNWGAIIELLKAQLSFRGQNKFT
jgi:hypothetical protein